MFPNTVYVKKCCCCVELKTGCVILCALDCISTLLGLSVLLYEMDHKGYDFEYIYPMFELLNLMLVTVFITGLYTKRPDFLQLYVYLHVVTSAGANYVVLDYMMNARDHKHSRPPGNSRKMSDIQIFISIVCGSALLVYFALVVLSYAAQLKEEEAVE